MKAGLLCVAGLSVLAHAQPHKHQRHHHEKRQVVNVVTDYDVVTAIEYVTATAPNAIVYVDVNGNPTSTSYEVAAPTTSAPEDVATSAAAAPATYAAPTSASAPPPPPSSSSAVAPPPAYTSAAAPSSYEAPAPVSSSSAESAAPAETSSAAKPSSTPASSGGATSGYGITYSPYNSDSTCKTQDQVNSDFEHISDYAFVRIYGTDCNQVATVNHAAAAKGIKLFAGVYDITKVQSEVQTIIDAGCLDNIHTVSIGNEGVNNGAYTAAAVVSAIGQARSQLQSAGYTGKVVTVDTFVAMIANPSICEASDYAAANCHAFFDGGVTAQDAGKFVLQQAQRVSEACGGKDTVITESGWPSQGDSNDQAVPSRQNQQDAVDSLKTHFSSNLVLFDMYNGYWKQNNAGTFNAEHYWGVYGDSPCDS